MKILKMDVDGVSVYNNVSIDFPTKGLVVVSGKNGSGKSSIIESVGLCFWKSSIRGDDLWSKPNPKITILTDSVEATRTKKSLIWKNLSDSKTVEYENATKAQEAFDKTFFSFQIWRNTCVFSSIDAANFSQATDAERKRLLERIFLLDKFNDALKKCKEELKILRRELSVEEGSLNVCNTNIRQTNRLIDEIKETIRRSDADESVPIESILAKRESLEINSKKANELKDGINALVEEKSIKQLEIKEAKEKYEKIKLGICDACGNYVHPDTIKELEGKLKSEHEFESELKKIDNAIRYKRNYLKDIENSVFQDTIFINEAEKTNIRELKKCVYVNDQRIKLFSVKEELENLEKSREAQEAKILSINIKIKELEAVEDVLGTKGVRVNILSRAVDAINYMANMYISKISSQEETIELSISQGDTITLEVVRPFGQTTYKASSQGERRRVDVATMLAISSVAQSQNGFSKSTLWFDEVFDSLDSDTCSKVVELLSEIAKNKCVVVITHNEDLIERIQTKNKWTVSNGTIRKIDNDKN